MKNSLCTHFKKYSTYAHMLRMILEVKLLQVKGVHACTTVESKQIFISIFNFFLLFLNGQFYFELENSKFILNNTDILTFRK